MNGTWLLNRQWAHCVHEVTQHDSRQRAEAAHVQRIDLMSSHAHCPARNGTIITPSCHHRAASTAHHGAQAASAGPLPYQPSHIPACTVPLMRLSPRPFRWKLQAAGTHPKMLK